ncbi:MAG: UvrD-helicase domain-containing protein [Desulfobacter sp.]|nr:MAG: UvrD-helicase domain-containing protein [Desulfobacter sp.]
MRFIADLHIHSKYSRATAKNLDLENLYHAAQIKGISLVGTGDFTHPAWMAELEEKLEETEPGLFSLKKEIADTIDLTVPPSCRREVRFILQSEISNIYKKEGRVRKNHNLIYLPDMETAKKFNARLDAIGNIKSDGRPILGLDARNLLEIMLETSEAGFFVPAHIWTPWFSMLGSKSGFDSIEECFGDLSHHIFACETGLSSDPPMNWRVKGLDHVRLISNSDAHSPGYLGRNASVFDTDLSFGAVRRALETRNLSAYRGTLDMYPDQGKYHYDGHRKCRVRLNPDETAELGGICPECGRPLTLGVLYRVRELAGRPEGYLPENRHPYTYIVPLADILSEIFEVGPKTKKVTGYYNKAVEALGSELEILTEMPIGEIDGGGVPLLAEAVKKMRSGDLHIAPGFDGEYGKVALFTREEKEEIRGEKNLLFTLPKKEKTAVKAKEKTAAPRVTLKKTKPAAQLPAGPKGLLEGLNPEQEKAVTAKDRAVLIQAGPGTGKTRTLTARIAWLVSKQNVDPGHILALTFTNKAARELSLRIDTFMPREGEPVLAATFHGFCLKMLKEYAGFSRGLMEDELRMEILGLAAESGMGTEGARPSKKVLRQMDNWISLAKQQFLGPEDDLAGVAAESAGILADLYRAYDGICRERALADFEDLIFECYRMLMGEPEILSRIRQRFSHLFVDEYQDLNLGQYELVKLLAAESRILVIGDPDQSIYGFRGSDNRFFNRFSDDYPQCRQIRLKRNYRSTQTILDASFQMITTKDARKTGNGVNEDRKIYSTVDNAQQVVIKESTTENAEAVAVGRMIEDLVGGLSFLSMDSGRDGSLNPDAGKEYAFSDFAVLYRTRRQCEAFVRAFEKAGIPFQTADRENWAHMAGVKEALAALRLMLNRGTGEDEALVKVALPRAVEGRTSAELLSDISGLLDLGPRLREKESLSAAWKRLTDLAGTWPVPGELLDALRLDQDQDLLDRKVEKVSLMTMHAAKGLEFPVVFVTGCETGMVPYARDGKKVEDLEEERRLFYVAMTRAMDILCLTYAQKRRIFGLEKKRERSCFIDDIERELARYDKMKKGRLKKRTEIQLELF